MMKKLLTVIALLFIAQQVALAESGDCRRGDRLIKKLNLNDDQVETVTQILEQQREKRHAIFEEHHKKMKTTMESLHNETKEQLSRILTEEQLTKFDEIKAKKRERMGERRSRHHGRHHETSGNTDNSRPDSNLII